MPDWQVIHGDALEVSRGMGEQSIHCAVTSPPYWGLRDYGVDGQLGLEKTPEEYVAKLVEIFREVRRVLRDDGTLFLNLGDKYVGGGLAGKEGVQKWGGIESGNQDRKYAPPVKPPPGLKPKDLVGIPWRVAFALQADGWWLRSIIVWAKVSCMPESINGWRWEQHRIKNDKDEWEECPGCEQCNPANGYVLRKGSWRPTTSHEYIFLLTKSETYYADAEAVKEAGTIPAGTRGGKASAERAGQPGVNSRPQEYKIYSGTRNLRSVWKLATKNFKGAHFATFPPELPERCIKAGTGEKGVCGNMIKKLRVKTNPPAEKLDALRRFLEIHGKI